MSTQTVKRDQFLVIRLSSAEREALRALVQQERQTQSQVVRALLTKAAQGA